MGAPRNNRPTLAAALIALLVAIIGLIAALNAGGTTVVKQSPIAASKVALRVEARAVERTAQSAPAPACVVPTNQGTLGACAPKPQFALAAQLFRLSGTHINPLSGPKGVDVSSYQGCRPAPTWVQFEYIKYTESTGYHDRCAPTNVRNARLAGQAYGGYDFLRPGSTSALAEADSFVNYGNSFGGFSSLPPVADVEATRLSRAGTSDYVCAWISRVFQRTHRVPIIYTGKWFWDPQTAGRTCGSALWVSAYASYFFLPSGFARATIWQYSDGKYGPLPHINGWDSDVFLGSTHELDLLSGKAPAVRPVSALMRHRCHVLHRLQPWRKLTKAQKHRHRYIRSRFAKYHIRCVGGKAARR